MKIGDIITVFAWGEPVAHGEVTDLFKDKSKRKGVVRNTLNQTIIVDFTDCDYEVDERATEVLAAWRENNHQEAHGQLSLPGFPQRAQFWMNTNPTRNFRFELAIHERFKPTVDHFVTDWGGTTKAYRGGFGELGDLNLMLCAQDFMARWTDEKGGLT